MVGPSVSPIYYLENDCQGTPYTGSPFYPPSAIVSSQRFFKSTGGTSLNQLTLSILESGVCKNQLFGPNPLHPLEEISFPFTLPLVGPLEIREN